MLTNWGSFCRMPRWSEVSVNLAEVKKDAQVVGGGARCRPRWRWSLGQYQSGARCRTQVVEGGGGAAHHLHLRLPQHPAQTGRQLGLWNKPGPLILLQNPNDPIIIFFITNSPVGLLFHKQRCLWTLDHAFFCFEIGDKENICFGL